MKHYTWEEKIESLVRLAKIIGVYLDVEIEAPGSDGHKGVREQLKEVYEEFCEWRHEEPYVVDEIKALLGRREYTDEATSVQLIIKEDNPDYPGTPKLTIVCPKDRLLSIQEINQTMTRLQERAGIPVEQRMVSLSWHES